MHRQANLFVIDFGGRQRAVTVMLDIEKPGHGERDQRERFAGRGRRQSLNLARQLIVNRLFKARREPGGELFDLRWH